MKAEWDELMKDLIATIEEMKRYAQTRGELDECGESIGTMRSSHRHLTSAGEEFFDVTGE